MRANDLEYDRRMDCGRTRDAVRTIKENGYDKTHPVFVKAAKQARYARMLYISKYKRDPFTLAPVDERGNAVDVDLCAASWTEVK
jgi:hypothetical protein